MCKIKYIDDDLSATLSNVNSWHYLNVWAGGSVFDPDVTGAGVQPYWHDQITAPYRRYQVYASKISVYPHCSDLTATNTIVRCYIIPYHTTSMAADTDPSDLGAMRLAAQKNFVGNQKLKKISNYASTRMVLGSNAKDNDCSANVGASPTTQFYWHVVFDDIASGSDVILTYDIKITYYVKFFELMNVNES